MWSILVLFLVVAGFSRYFLDLARALSPLLGVLRLWSVGGCGVCFDSVKPCLIKKGFSTAGNDNK